MTVTTLDVDTSKTDTDDGLVHLWCCDIDLSMCGRDIEGWPIAADTTTEPLCVVCRDLASRPCERCGDPGVEI